MSIIPNPLVILFFDETRTKWVFATHEKKKDGLLASKTLYEVQEIVTLQQVEEQLNFENLNKTNLKRFMNHGLSDCYKLNYNLVITFIHQFLYKIIF